MTAKTHKFPSLTDTGGEDKKNYEIHDQQVKRRSPRAAGKHSSDVEKETYVGWSKEASLCELVTFCFKKKTPMPMHKRGNTSVLEFHIKHEEAVKEQKWFGLFTDLIFVTVIIQFAYQITYHHVGFFLYPYDAKDITRRYDLVHSTMCKEFAAGGAKGIFLLDTGLECDEVEGGINQWLTESVLWLFVFYVVWLELGCALGRFINIDGVLDDLLYYGVIICIICMTIQIAPQKRMMDERNSFTIWTSFAFLALLVLHLFYYYMIEACRRYAWRRIWAYAIAIIINAVGAHFSYWTNYVSILISSLVVFYVSLTGFISQPETDLTIEHFIERFGLLIMITTGESILAIIISEGYTQSTEQNLMFFFSFVILYVLKDQYFNTDAPEKVHALTKNNFPGACVWVFLHFPLSYLILLLGVGFNLVFLAFENKDTKPYKEMLLLPLALSLVVIDLLPLTHPYYKFCWQAMIAKLIPIVLCVVVGEILDDSFYILISCAVFTLLHFTVDVALRKYQVDKNAVREYLHENKAEVEDIFDEWRSTGFMGPKVEIWPIYLLVDCWKNEPEISIKRARETNCEEELLIPNKHYREEENTHDWLMEFGDLILVGVIFKFADQMKYTLYNDDIYDTYVVIYESVFFFAAFFCIWLELVMEFVRFKNMPGPIDDLVRFFYLFFLAMMATQIDGERYLMTNKTGVLFCFAGSLFAIFFLHLCYLYHGIEHGKAYCIKRVIVYGMVIFTTVISVIILKFMHSYWTPFCIFVLNVMLILITSLNSFRVTVTETEREQIYEQHKHEASDEDEEDSIEDHFMERFGLFVMITAGETILALVIAYEKFEETMISYLLVYIAFTMIYVMRTQYVFNNINLQDGHALHNERSPGSVMFCGIHMILTLFLLWLGVAWKLVFYKWTGSGDVILKYRIYMGVAVTGVMICLIICRFTHTNFVPGILSWLRIIPVGSVMFICDLWTQPLHFSIGCVACLMCLLVMDHKFYNITYEIAKDGSDSEVEVV